MGSSIKNVRSNLEILGTSVPPAQACPHLVHSPSPCPCGHKASITWNIATYEQFTVKGKKNYSFCLKITFEWRQYLKWCHYIAFHTFSIEYNRTKILYTDILPIVWVNFTNMVAIFFFQADFPIWLTTPPPPPSVCIFPLLPDPLPLLMCGRPLWMVPLGQLKIISGDRSSIPSAWTEFRFKKHRFSLLKSW